MSSAVVHSYEISNLVLELVIKKLFDESLKNCTLTDLLNAVLFQNSTPQQAINFQAYIKVMQKQIKAQKVDRNFISNCSSSEVDINMSSKSAFKSPFKSVQLEVTGENCISKEATLSHSSKSNFNSDSVLKNKLFNGKISEVNNMKT